MGVTNYFSANGVLLGEDGPNGKVDYLTDALGSVVTTANQSGTLLNEYRYKPYGAMLSKSGSATDPEFLWVGTQGYRNLGLKHSDVYVRARHFSSLEGAWTTIDSWWPAQRPFAYATNKPTQEIDPTGFIGVLSANVTAESKNTGPCGAPAVFPHVFVEWGVTQLTPATYDGYIVQHVTGKLKTYSCFGKLTQNVAILKWEAWQVIVPWVYQGYAPANPPGIDPWVLYTPGGQTLTQSLSTTAYYFANIELAWPTCPGPDGPLPCQEPGASTQPFWSNPTSNALNRSWSVSFTCCPSSSRTWTMTYTP